MRKTMLFKDRQDAGRQLVTLLHAHKQEKETIVLGLARGGVVTAFEVARELGLPLNVVVVRKVGAPGNPELALGAVTETGEGFFNDNLIRALGVTTQYLHEEIARQKKVAEERLALYRGKLTAPQIKNKTVILVDDGVATGASIRAAIRSIRAQGVKKIIVALPVAAPDAVHEIEKEVDEVACLSIPAFFEAVGMFYSAFEQVSDEEIITLLAKTV